MRVNPESSFFGLEVTRVSIIPCQGLLMTALPIFQSELKNHLTSLSGDSFQNTLVCFTGTPAIGSWLKLIASGSLCKPSDLTKFYAHFLLSSNDIIGPLEFEYSDYVIADIKMPEMTPVYRERTPVRISSWSARNTTFRSSAI